jgi:hypothetical protein
MQPRHAAGLCVILAAAVFLGAFAGFRSAALSARASQASAAAPTTQALQLRARRLDRWEAALRRTLHRRPPRLPAIPHFAPPPPAPAPQMVAAPVPAASAPVAAAPRVVYVRPHRVVIVHRHHGEHDDGGGSAEGGGGGGDD